MRTGSARTNYDNYNRDDNTERYFFLGLWFGFLRLLGRGSNDLEGRKEESHR